MINCINCDLPITDGYIECEQCGAPLHRYCKNECTTCSCVLCDACALADEHCKKENVLDVLRRSHIELYRTCPMKFQYEVLQGMKDPDDCYTAVGSDLHELFDLGSHGKILDTQEMYDIFKEQYWDKYPDELFDVSVSKKNIEEMKEQMHQRAIDSIDTFFDVVGDMPKEPLATEVNVRIDIGENLPKVSCTIDRVDEIEGELHISDWKTGKVMVGKKLAQDLQAPLYIYGAREHFGVPVHSFTLFYVHENKKRVYVKKNENEYVCTVGKREYTINLLDAIREVKSIFNKINKGLFDVPHSRKGMFYTCKTCHVKENGMCQGSEMQIWHQMGGR